MIGIYLLTITTEILRFAMIFHGLLGYSFRNGKLKYGFLLLPLIGLGAIYFPIELNTLTLFIVFELVNFFSMLYLYNEKIKKLIIIYIPVALATITWDNLFIEIFKLFYQFNEDRPIDVLVRQFLCHILLILFISILWFSFRKRNLLHTLSKDRISRPIYFIILSGIFTTSFIISISRVVSESSSNRSVAFSYLAMIILSIIFQIVCFALILLFYSREQFKTVNRIREDYTEKQIDYYKALLTQEEDTRKFRHDIKNHIICIQELLENNKLKDAQEYVKDIFNSLDKITSIYDTGSDIINAIINYYITLGKEYNISVQVKGHMRPEINIPMMHLCTVISNIMSNAYEAALKANCNGEKIIYVELRSGSKFFEFHVKNPTDSNRDKLDDSFMTSKSDKANHGYGIRSIKEIILKYDGTFHLIDDLDSVTVKVVMKIA